MTILTERPQLADFLVAHGLVESLDDVTMQPLSGGVSSDIWLLHDGAVEFVVKQPLGELKVASEWRAPLARSASEANWLLVVDALLPGACPKVLAFDPEANLLAMEYLDASAHRLWKSDLLGGRVDAGVAAAVGDTIGTIHERTADRAELAERFDTDDLFLALRIEPYFQRLIASHPELAPPVDRVIRATMAHKRALVHGDVSPKNILIGPRGPVLVDAETAWWGDPAFDVAFCLNHLLLKCLDPGRRTSDLIDACEALVAAYAPHVVWESPDALMGRVAGLLPLLLLARVDGRSPVDYLEPSGQALVRAFAIPRILNHPGGLSELFADWKDIAA